MEVTDQLVNNLANLARLRFDDAERTAIKSDLQKMIAFVEQLQQVNTSQTAPLMHMGDAINAYRQDIVKGSMDKTTALQNAPLANNDYFKVPKVIKK
ncbi:MAG: Asp-tRNA(Asn)/Glu-tRNA(Gln) amidotransferase subunit GatC [Sphingobacteriales bacterium]|jgi:aspartyl-tRNA(Asn)/glutamyl-tRNA(Gln) amidotransferase subunit C|nr:MAG: Asp-tRNA(Asn)/Glu-tRNA(Gln) amidotransferase subunit GatC [Sphingobacteriales bacterium]